MNIGIVDVDGHNFPNFALMKISAWHKSQGDNVEIALPLFGNYDRVYQSKIFTFTPDSTDFDGTCEVIRVCYGGLDLSSTTDITAFVLVFPPRDEDDKYVVLPYFWVPERIHLASLILFPAKI